jgi:predicted transcriptional regulator
MNAPQDIKFRFNPSSSKSKKVLGPLEGDIMEIVWDQGPSTVATVHKALREHKDIAYTTVMTTMSRLAKKNLLHQDRSAASYIYSAALTKTDFDKYVIGGIIRALISDYGDAFVDCFVDMLDDLSPSGRDRLLKAAGLDRFSEA